MSGKAPYSNSVIVYEDSDALAIGAAQHFVKTVDLAIRLRGVAFVALSGGSTPKRLFSILASNAGKLKVVWDKVHFFWVDERMVPYTSPESNYGVAKRLLFDLVDVPLSNIHPIPILLQDSGVVGSIGKVLEDYSSKIDSLIGKEPEFDLILLGMGDDGHTASIFPGLQGLHPQDSEESNPDGGKWAFAVTAGSPLVTRVSLKEELITGAKQIIFVVGGSNKAEMVKSALQWPQDKALDLPAGRVTSKAKGRTLWLLDKAASTIIEGESFRS